MDFTIDRTRFFDVLSSFAVDTSLGLGSYSDPDSTLLLASLAISSAADSTELNALVTASCSSYWSHRDQYLIPCFESECRSSLRLQLNLESVDWNIFSSRLSFNWLVFRIRLFAKLCSVYPGLCGYWKTLREILICKKDNWVLILLEFHAVVSMRC